MIVGIIFGVVTYPEDKLDYGFVKFDISDDEPHEIKYLSHLDLNTFKENSVNKLQSIGYENLIKAKFKKNNRWLKDNLMYMEDEVGFVIVDVSVVSSDIPKFSMEFPMQIEVETTIEESLIKWSDFVSEEIRTRANTVREDYMKFREERCIN